MMVDNISERSDGGKTMQFVGSTDPKKVSSPLLFTDFWACGPKAKLKFIVSFSVAKLIWESFGGSRLAHIPSTAIWVESRKNQPTRKNEKLVVFRGSVWSKISGQRNIFLLTTS